MDDDRRGIEERAELLVADVVQDRYAVVDAELADERLVRGQSWGDDDEREILATGEELTMCGEQNACVLAVVDARHA